MSGDTRTRILALLERIERDTETAGFDRGIPHVAELAREAARLVRGSVWPPVTSPDEANQLLDWLEKNGEGCVRGTDYPKWSIEGSYGQSLRGAIRFQMRQGKTNAG